MASPHLEPNAGSFAAASLQSSHRNLLRFTTAGSVDDGKSTLIGRLLFDSQAVYEDQLASVKKSRINRSTGPIDFSLLTDGLRAEREQGITIDVAYRYFSTPRRKFIIADTPGHEQYTRNMATGASTADAAIILLDATKGLLPQSRRHAYIASLLGIRHVIAAVNKMDLVAYSQETFDRITGDFHELAGKLGLFSVYAVPISALEGDNVVQRSGRTPWFEGPSLLQHLEEIPDDDTPEGTARFPVQYVIRPDANFRGFAGELASGTLRAGETVVVLPSNVKSKIKAIVTYDGEIEEVRAGNAVTITLEDEVDISRGDMLVAEDKIPHVSRNFESKLVWMSPEPLDPGKLYLLKHTTRSVRARITTIKHRVDVNTLVHHEARTLEMNDIASVAVETTLPLFFDPYRQIRNTGGFILIDPITNATVAAGMIERVVDELSVVKTALSEVSVAEEERTARFGHASAAVMVVAAHKTAAELLERTLFDQGWNAALIDATRFDYDDLNGAAKALKSAGVIAIFVTTHPSVALRATFKEALFEIGEGGGSDLELVSKVRTQLTEWNGKIGAKGARQ